MPQTKTVEVMNVSRATEATTGENIYLVQFGELKDATPEIRKSIPTPPNTMPPKKVFENIMILYFNFGKVAPYKVGSKWRLEIADNGEIKLKEIE
ncbi:MAG: hypothetical protein V1494_04295 [Candidatus Diapherotrites archaeon]